MGREDTKMLILEAAVKVFSRHGFSGTKIESVAAEAGCNKALIYRYFKDKDGLLKAALRDQFEHRAQHLGRVPEQLNEMLAYWFRQTKKDTAFIRLMLFESLESAPSPTAIEKKFRSEYYRQQIDRVRSFQENGILTNKLDARYLFLALMALVVFPSVLPTVTTLVSQKSATGKAFEKDWLEFLTQLADLLNDEN